VPADLLDRIVSFFFRFTEPGSYQQLLNQYLQQPITFLLRVSPFLPISVISRDTHSPHLPHMSVLRGNPLLIPVPPCPSIFFTNHSPFLCDPPPAGVSAFFPELDFCSEVRLLFKMGLSTWATAELASPFLFCEDTPPVGVFVNFSR